MKFQGRSILISGAGRGIGWALACEAARRGAIVHLLSRKPLAAEKLSELTNLGAPEVHSHALDLENIGAIRETLQKWRDQKWAPDILVNNAGQLTGGLLEKQSIDEIYRMMQVNLLATIHLTHGLLPTMLERGTGLIVNNSSVSGKMFFPCASTYAASKAGVVAFSESLRQELRETGVKVLLLLTPGVKTDMYDQISESYGENLNLSFLSAMPSGKWATRVCDAIQEESEVVHPDGSTGLALRLAVHLPKVFELAVRRQFHRKT